MERLVKISTPIKGLFIIKTIRVEDARGHLSRLFCSREIEKFGWKNPLVQVNFARTLYAGTVRGFHFQVPPYAEYKYVRCIRGEIFDVALDLRKNSKSFLQTHLPLNDFKTKGLRHDVLAYAYEFPVKSTLGSGEIPHYFQEDYDKIIEYSEREFIYPELYEKIISNGMITKETLLKSIQHYELQKSHQE